MSGHVTPVRRDRIFHRFGKWSLVPAEDLLKLRQSLHQAQKLLGPPVASELLDLLGQVDQELRRRAQTPRWGRTSGSSRPARAKAGGYGPAVGGVPYQVVPATSPGLPGTTDELCRCNGPEISSEISSAGSGHPYRVSAANHIGARQGPAPGVLRPAGLIQDRASPCGASFRTRRTRRPRGAGVTYGETNPLGNRGGLCIRRREFLALSGRKGPRCRLRRRRRSHLPLQLPPASENCSLHCAFRQNELAQPSGAALRRQHIRGPIDADSSDLGFLLGNPGFKELHDGIYAQLLAVRRFQRRLSDLKLRRTLGIESRPHVATI